MLIIILSMPQARVISLLFEIKNNVKNTILTPTNSFNYEIHRNRYANSSE